MSRVYNKAVEQIKAGSERVDNRGHHARYLLEILVKLGLESPGTPLNQTYIEQYVESHINHIKAGPDEYATDVLGDLQPDGNRQHERVYRENLISQLVRILLSPEQTMLTIGPYKDLACANCAVGQHCDEHQGIIDDIYTTNLLYQTFQLLYKDAEHSTEIQILSEQRYMIDESTSQSLILTFSVPAWMLRQLLGDVASAIQEYLRKCKLEETLTPQDLARRLVWVAQDVFEAPNRYPNADTINEEAVDLAKVVTSHHLALD